MAAALAVGDVAARGSTVAEAVGQVTAQAAALRLLTALLRVGGAAMPAALRATADVAALHTATAAEAAVEVRLGTCSVHAAASYCRERSPHHLRHHHPVPWLTSLASRDFMLTLSNSLLHINCDHHQALRRGQGVSTAPARRLQLAAYAALTAAATVPGHGSRSAVLPAATALIRRGAQDASPDLAALSSQVSRG